MVAEVSTILFMDRNLSGRRRYRSWPEALKREIVAATYEAGSSVSEVARRYEVNANQVFAWRKRFGPSAPETTRMVPVVVTPEASTIDVEVAPTPLIEIALAGGYRVRVGEGVPAAMLRQVLDVLERR
jgi:transposase